MKKHLQSFMLLMVMAMILAFNIPLVLTADASIPRKEAGLQSYPVGVDIIYKGAEVCLNTDGYLVAAADTAGYRFVGIAYEQVDNSGGDAGDLNCRVHTQGVFLLTATSITQAMVGKLMYVADDASIDDTSSNFICVGRLVQYVSTTSGWVDIGQRGINLDGSGEAIKMSVTGEGYSLNVINITSTGTVGEGTRGLRINATSADGIASGDLQCFHGYLTLGTSPELAANAAVYPLSGWVNIPDDATIGNGALIAGCRVIFDPNNNDLSDIGGGGESALFYGQTWASSGAIDHGLAIIAGAGSTIDSMIHHGGSGTIGKILDFTEWAAPTKMMFMEGGPSHDGATAHFKIAIGRQTDNAGIAGEVGASDYGSLYISVAAGKLFQNQSGTWTDIS